MDDVFAHAAAGRIGILGTICLADRTTQPISDPLENLLMKQFDDLITALTVGSPARHETLSVYPLTYKDRCAAPTYLVLDEALATGRFRITEVSEGGSVPRLLAINDNNAPVLLLDGEELVGAKQNRVLNLSIMLAPNSKTEIPVSCVEAGRWHFESQEFQATERIQFARGRAQKMDQVSRSLFQCGEAQSDQSAIWEAIAAKSARMRVASPTGAMAALFESCRGDLREYLDAIPITDRQVGAVYAIGDSIVGIEVFDSDTTFKRLSGKLLASYALDAMEMKRPGGPPNPNVIHAFVQSVCTETRRPATTVGIGTTIRLVANDLAGAALEVAGNCIHVAAFRRQAFEDQSSGQDLQEVRLLRPSARARRL